MQSTVVVAFLALVGVSLAQFCPGCSNFYNPCYGGGCNSVPRITVIQTPSSNCFGNGCNNNCFGGNCNNNYYQQSCGQITNCGGCNSCNTCNSCPICQSCSSCNVCRPSFFPNFFGNSCCSGNNFSCCPFRGKRNTPQVEEQRERK